MDVNIETNFVRTCVRKEYQDRLIFELQSNKRREKALSKFAHSSKTILQEQFVTTTMSNLRNNLSSLANSTEHCYIISGGINDGITMALRDAIKQLETSYMLVILISQNFIVVKEEAEGNTPLVMLLEIKS